MNNWIILRTIVVTEILRFMRIWTQTIVPPVVITILYLLIFGKLIGARIGPMLEIDYLHFIVPGIILMTVIQNSYSNTVASFYLSKFNHSIEELLVSPVANWIILVGYVFGGALRGILVGITVAIVVSFFVELQIHNLAVLLIILVMTAVLFSLAGFINAIFANSFDDISIVPTFVLMPLIYLGGMFYSIDVLPEFWQSFSYFNPIFYMVDSFRFGFLGVQIVDFKNSIIVIFIMIVILFTSSLILLNRGVNLKS